jgi:hypothetical protein
MAEHGQWRQLASDYEGSRVVGLDVTDEFLPVPEDADVRFQHHDLSRLADFS